MTGYKKIITCALLLPTLAGCVDDKYDLSDIDTTVKIDIDNLTIPVNIDKITLGNIIKPNENQIEIVNGQYAIVYDGSFTSQGIKVDAINLKAPTIAPSETTISLINPATHTPRNTEFSYGLANPSSEFQFTSTSNVSDFIYDIDQIGANLRLDINISLLGLENIVSRVTFKDIVLQLPKGLSMQTTVIAGQSAKYDAVSGEYTILGSIATTGTTLNLSLIANGLNFHQAGGSFDTVGRSITLPGNMHIKSGTATISTGDLISGSATLPTNIKLRSEYDIFDTQITSFSGTINQYDITDSKLTDVDLTGLPNLLTQPATDIRLVNPMIYLQINNPLQAYGNLYAETALSIESSREGSPASTFTSDIFNIGKPAIANGTYNLCLSPKTPWDIDGYPEATHVQFTTLSSVLSGNGLPSHLTINLDNPHLPAMQTVTDFPLTGPANTIGAFDGKYRFVAPLQFEQGSTVTYSDKIDGWSSEDLNNVTVTSLDITLTISTNIPVGVEFEGHPIDATGNQIDNVEIVGATVSPNANNQKVTIHMTGKITGLDGVQFIAKAKAASEGAPLTPDMDIRLTDIRPTISGYYEKEL